MLLGARDVGFLEFPANEDDTTVVLIAAVKIKPISMTIP